MNPNDNQNSASPDAQQSSPPATIITPTAEAGNTSGQQLFNPMVEPRREQSTIESLNPQPSQADNSQTNNSLNPTKPQQQKSKPKVLVIVVAALVSLLVITIIAVLFSGGSKKPAKTTDETSQQEPAGPQPASALDVEQSNNSINQDMSTLSDEEDFPETQIDNKALGL